MEILEQLDKFAGDREDKTSRMVREAAEEIRQLKEELDFYKMRYEQMSATLAVTKVRGRY